MLPCEACERNGSPDGPPLYFDSTTIVDLDNDGVCEAVSSHMDGFIRDGKNTIWCSKIYVWVYSGTSTSDDWTLNTARYQVHSGGNFDRMVSEYPDSDGCGRVFYYGKTIYGKTVDGKLIGEYSSQILDHDAFTYGSMS